MKTVSCVGDREAPGKTTYFDAANKRCFHETKRALLLAGDSPKLNARRVAKLAFSCKTFSRLFFPPPMRFRSAT